MRLCVDFSAQSPTTEQGKPAARQGRKVTGLARYIRLTR